jgi:hypothetical protein
MRGTSPVCSTVAKKRGYERNPAVIDQIHVPAPHRFDERPYSAGIISIVATDQHFIAIS